MVFEPNPDVTGPAEASELQGSRCVNCGNIEDAAIYTNRLKDHSARGAARRHIGVEARSDRMKIGTTSG